MASSEMARPASSSACAARAAFQFDAAERRDDEVQLRAAPHRDLHDDHPHFIFLGPGDHRDVGLDDPGFFQRDGGQRIAEPLLVVEVDAREDADGGGYHVGGIEPPAEAGLQHHHLRAALLKPGEREGGGDLEKGRCVIPLLDERADLGEPGGDFVFADHFAIEPHAFAEGHEMRRGEKARLQTGGAAARVEHRADGAFPIGAGDVEKLRRFRPGHADAERDGETLDVFQSEVDAVELRGVEPRDGLFVIHFAGAR